MTGLIWKWPLAFLSASCRFLGRRQLELSILFMSEALEGGNLGLERDFI